MKDFISQNWNPEIGLWSSEGQGHTEGTKGLSIKHSGCDAAAKLVVAGQAGILGRIDIEKVLSALRAMQSTEPGELQGCIRWYWEESRIYDSNAAFFTGQSLIVLRKVWYDQLDEKSRELLDTILHDLKTWFTCAISHRTYNYPNKYLGDLVCGWMLLEILDCLDESSPVLECMREATDYWSNRGWGWGEHMSDCYSKVMLDQLSLLVLLAEKLPDDVLAIYKNLLDELLSIEDAYSGGGRVPALRSYSFLESPRHIHYRDLVKPWDDDEDLRIGNQPPLGSLFYQLGWHNLVSKKSPSVKDVSVPCFDGAVATACIEPDIRIGAVTRFPVMPSAEYQTWGLSWQCFPTAFWRPQGDWGFHQWQTVENGRSCSHPASSTTHSHFRKTHTDNLWPPIVGRTYTIQRGGDILVLRIMSPIIHSFEKVVDRFRLVDGHADVNINNCADGWSQLLLKYPERTVSVSHVELMKEVSCALAENIPGVLDWEAVIAGGLLREKRCVISLWGMSLNGEITNAPVVETSGSVFMARSDDESLREIHWEWPRTTWDIRIDPLSANPLVEV